jgi:hypothetical protein
LRSTIDLSNAAGLMTGGVFHGVIARSFAARNALMVAFSTRSYTDD